MTDTTTDMKLALMEAIDVKAVQQYGNHHRAADALQIPCNDLYRIHSRRIDMFSLHRLCMLIDKLGGRVTVRVD